MDNPLFMDRVQKDINSAGPAFNRTDSPALIESLILEDKASSKKNLLVGVFIVINGNLEDKLITPAQVRVLASTLKGDLERIYGTGLWVEVIETKANPVGESRETSFSKAEKEILDKAVATKRM